MLVLTPELLATMVADCLDGAPLEACGILVGAPDLSGRSGPLGRDAAVVSACLPATNVAASARVYTVAPGDLLRADRQAEAAGAEIIGVYHSHTHTDAWPSPTDVAQAPDPSWHYVLVSLRDTEPTLRCYRIRDSQIEEEPVVLQ